MIVHCTITAQMMKTPGYLEGFLRYLSPKPEIKKFWMSMFTPQRGAYSPECLSDEERGRAVDELLCLLDIYTKLDMARRAIREFRKVLFGFDQQASAEIQRWQAKAGLEAGQCAGLLAAQQTNPAERNRLVSLAREFFQQVKTRYPSSQEAAAAGEQLRKFGG